MNFDFSPEQEQLRASAREFLAREAPVSFARAMMDDPIGFSESSWRALADLGWIGLTAPDDCGGSALGLLDAVLVLEELGAVVYPGPFFSTVCLGVECLLATATAAERAAILPAVVEGKKRLTLAVAETSGSWAASAVALTAKRADGGYVLGGTKLFVPDARSADSILVAARLQASGIGVFEVPRATAGMRVEPMTTVDQTRKLDAVVLEDVRVGAASLLGGRAISEPAFDTVIDRAKVALAAEMCGAARAALDRSVEYAKIRTQFDRPIGSFQAVQHKLADMKVALENARSLVYYAAWALDSGAEDARLAAAMAKAYGGDACGKIVADAIQVHGGIGFTWEHDMHLYYKRVKAGEVSYGDATANRELVAGLLGL